MGKVDLSVIGTKTEPRVFEYTWQDVVLYNLGIGASANDLAFVYENAPGGLKVLPSFCVVPARWAIFYVGAGGFGGDPGPKTERMENHEHRRR